MTRDRTAGLVFDFAGPADDPDLRRLLRDNPMEGDVELTFEREPSASLAAAIEGEDHRTVVAREPGTGVVVAMGSRAVASAFVNGEPARVGYLSQLRVAPSHRHRRQVLTGGFARLFELHRADGRTRHYVTTIMEDNRPARRLLERGLPGLPAYREVGRLVTLALPTGQGARGATPSGVRVERGSPERLPDVVACLERNGRRFQLARRWTLDDLRSEERTRGLRPEDFLCAVRDEALVGCLARWDQRAYKQAVVRGYSRRLGRVRRLNNLLAPLTGAPRLPPVGSTLDAAFLSHVAVDADDMDVGRALVRAALRDARGRFELLYLGLAEGHPLLGPLTSWLRSFDARSVIYTVDFDGGGSGTPPIDDRVPHLEAATL